MAGGRPLSDIAAALDHVDATVVVRAEIVTASLTRAIGRVKEPVGRASRRTDQHVLVEAVDNAAADMAAQITAAAADSLKAIRRQAKHLRRLAQEWERIVAHVAASLQQTPSHGPVTVRMSVDPDQGDLDLPRVVERLDSASSSAPPTGTILTGYHNDNVVVHTSDGVVVVRIPTETRLTGISRYQPQPWTEAQVLDAISPHLSFIPEVIHRASDTLVLRWVEGVKRDWTRPLPPGVAEAMGAAMGQMATLSAAALPELPSDWPADGDSAASVRMLLAVPQGIWDNRDERFTSLYESLGMPADPFGRIYDQLEQLTSRSFGLLHWDLHWHNILLTPEPILLDWEFASFGDPLIDVAIHLEKLPRYSNADERRLLGRWVSVAGPARSREHTQDLPVIRHAVALANFLGDVSMSARKAHQLNDPSAVAGPTPPAFVQYLTGGLNRFSAFLRNDPTPVDESFVIEQLRRIGAGGSSV